jgi:hypothetical protein
MQIQMPGSKPGFLFYMVKLHSFKKLANHQIS